MLWLKSGEGAYAIFYENDEDGCLTERVELPPDSLLLIRPGERHGIFFAGPSCQPHLHFDLIEDEYSDNLPILFRNRKFCTPEELSLVRQDLLASYPIPHRLDKVDHSIFSNAILECFELRAKGDIFSLLTIKSKITASVAHLISCYGQTDAQNSDNEIARHIRSFIIEWYASDLPKKMLTLDDLSGSLFLSKYHLSRLFTKAYGISPMRWANSVRIHRADAMLASGRFNISETAAAIGFESPFSFSRFYKTQRGFPPTMLLRHSRQ